MPATTTTEAVLAALDGQPDRTAAELAAGTGWAGRRSARRSWRSNALERRIGQLAATSTVAAARTAGRSCRPLMSSRRPTGGLRRGQLRALVAEHLRQHAEVEHTPTTVAKALGRSAGAVSNALDRLAADGAVEQTSVAPRRFRYGR